MGGPSGLAAARRVLDLEVEPGDPDVVAPALALISWADPEPTLRQAAARRVLALHASAPQDDERLIVALQPSRAPTRRRLARRRCAGAIPRAPSSFAAGVLEADPSSPEWLHRLDGLLANAKPAAKRLARYEAALRARLDRGPPVTL